MPIRMRFSAVLTCAVLAVAACNGGGTPTAVTKSSKPTTTSKPSVRPTPTPTPTPIGKEDDVVSPRPTDTPIPFGASPSTTTTQPSTGASAKPDTPVLPPQVSTPGKTSVTGAVYDLDGNKLIKGVNVDFKGASFEKRFDYDDPDNGGTSNGAYASDTAFPPGVYTVTATGYGFTPRVRHITIQKDFQSTVNFGTPNADDACFALSDFPEVSSVDVGDPNAVDPTHIQMTIHLSEPLIDAQKGAFVSDLQLMPVNDVASGVASPQPDLSTQDPVTTLANAFSYALTFPGPATGYYGQKCTFTWANDRDLTISWGIPLLDGPNPGVYQLGLVSAGATQQVVDISTLKHQIGMNETFDQTKWPDAGHFVNKVFLDPNLSPGTFKGDSAQHRWTSSHLNVFQFKLKPDAKPPTFTGISATELHTQPTQGATAELGMLFAASFDKVLVAFGPGGVVNAKSALDPANYTFAVGINTDYLNGTAFLDGVSNVRRLGADYKDYGKDESADLGKEFGILAPPAGSAAKLTVQLNPNDPHQVMLQIDGNTNLLYHDLPCLTATSVKAIKARVSGVQDPYGNAITTATANQKANQPAANITWGNDTTNCAH